MPRGGAGSFAEFYPQYLAAHRHPLNRALHLGAKLAALGAIGLAFARRDPLAALAAPVLAVVPCWIGHWAVEGNRPTAWTRPSASLLGALALRITNGSPAPSSSAGRPWYSVLADLRMGLDGVRRLLGRLRRRA